MASQAVGVVMVMLSAATATADAQSGPDIVVTAPGMPLHVDARILRAAQRRFARDRMALAPTGRLSFELWRGNVRVSAADMDLRIGDGVTELPVSIGADGRFSVPAIPDGRWFISGKAGATALTLRPMILSDASTVEDRRLGDLRAQCQAIVAMGKAQASVLAWPMIGVFDVTGGCASRHFRFFYPADHPLAAATVAGRALPLSPKAMAFQPPLSDRSLGNEARVRLLYR